MEKRDKNGLTEAEFLRGYNPDKYKKPSVTADIAVFRKNNKHTQILLIVRGGHPFLGFYALPGGFLNEGETALESAQRELFEETNIENAYLEPVGVYSTPGRDPRMWVISCAFVSVISEEDTEVSAKDDAAEALWFDIEKEIVGENVKIYFKNEKESFSVLLKMHIENGFTGKNCKFEIIDGARLGFDHALIIADSMHKISLL